MREKINELLAVQEACIYPHFFHFLKSFRMRLLEYAREEEPEESIDMAMFDVYIESDFQYILEQLKYICITYFNGEFNLFPDHLGSYTGFELLFIDVENAYRSTSPTIKRKCRDCGEDFYIYMQEVDFYTGKCLELPKRCKSCRQKRKLLANKEKLDEAV